MKEPTKPLPKTPLKPRRLFVRIYGVRNYFSQLIEDPAERTAFAFLRFVDNVAAATAIENEVCIAYSVQ
jgi:hypothetical protein